MDPTLSRLINEIATITGLTQEEVTQNFTKEQLDHLLKVSKCDVTTSVSPIATSLDEIPCKDLGAPLDSIIQEVPDIPIPDGPADSVKCVDAVDRVNKKVKEKQDLYFEYVVILNKLYEFKDNLSPLKFYYEERARELAKIVGEFAPILSQLKSLTDQIYNIENTKIPAQSQIISDENSKVNPDQTIIESAQSAVQDLESERLSLLTKKQTQETLLQSNQEKYPLMLNGVISNYQNTNQGFSARQTLKSEIKDTITNSTINNIKRGLKNFSEYVSLDINVKAGSYSKVLKNPIIGFKIEFQDLNQMKIDKEEFDKETGKSRIEKKKYPIKNNSLLQENSFFEGAPGFSVKNVRSKEKSKGVLYEKYYNLLDDPIVNFFTLGERGLTSNISQLDPKLKGSDTITKKENQTEYFIQDLDKMQSFYQNFEKTFETRKAKVRNKIIRETLSISKIELENVAKMDVQLLLSLGQLNVFDPQSNRAYSYTDLDGSSKSFNGGINSGAVTALESVSQANMVFIDLIAKLDSEISRIESLIEDIKPNPERVKKMLKEESGECFGNIPDDLDEDSGCPDIDALKGSDPFFQTIDGIDPTLPNFSQGCYWKEFGKLATIQGLFPIPNNPTTLRYWPVGLIIPTPATLIKIPLPIVWIHLITISTPLGILVVYLTINGIFISPIVFFVSSSGYKQHLITIRGSSKKFGYDKNDNIIKSTIKIPLAAQAALDMSKIGGKIDINSNATDLELAKLKSLDQRRQEAVSSGDVVSAHKAKKEISGMNTAIRDRVVPESQKMKEITDTSNEAEEAVQSLFKNVYKAMDNIGKPPTTKIDELKEKQEKRRASLKSEKLKAMESGDSERVKQINSELKSDGLDVNDKVNAFTQDCLAYFDRLPFSKEVFPKDKDKLNPKELPIMETVDRVQEEASKLNVDYVSDQSTQLKTIVGKVIAKSKDDLESSVNVDSINIDEDPEKAKAALSDMVDRVSDNIKGTGASSVDPLVEARALSDSKTRLDNSSSETREQAELELAKSQESLTKKMNAGRIRNDISINAGVIAGFANFRVSFDPFAKCCASDTFTQGIPFPPLTELAIDQAINLIKSSISSISNEELKNVFGGKVNVNPKDIRLGLLSIVQSKIPASLKIPKPDLNLKSAALMFSGLLGSLAMPQASFPGPLSADLVPKKITIDFSILKEPIKEALSNYLSTNLIEKNAQSLLTDFEYSNSNDIKSFMKKFIESQEELALNKIRPILSVLERAKNSNGLDLNVLEASVFNVPPYGPLALALFIAKGKIKLNLDKSQFQFVINQDAVKIASEILKTALSPIVTNPVAYILVAAAGVTNRLDLIRKIHPILNADDIPPWERLTLKNVLFLVFLDEFISTASDQVGWFRSFL